MIKFVRTKIILIGFCLIFATWGHADVVYIQNGDKLYGKLKSPSFTVRTVYGKIRIEKEFLKSLSFENRSVGRWVIESINNDRFSGTLLDERIQFVQDDGEHKTVSREKIRRIRMETRGPSYPITTIIFTTKNNDRFSGKFLNPQVKIQTKTIAKTINPQDINRIEFIDEFQTDTKILLENGDLISGVLQNDRIRIAPDAVTEFSVAKSHLKAIQFNAPKMVLRQFGNPARLSKDADEDGIPDFADLCPQTPRGSAVDQHGCPQKSIMASRIVEKKEDSADRAERVQPVGQIGEFAKILFDFDRYELKPQYYSILDDVVERLMQDTSLKIQIQGHTDNIGTDAYNQNLSENRAQTVRQYLVGKGIEEQRLFAKGFGFTINIASNASEAGRALNRRVEIAPQN